MTCIVGYVENGVTWLGGDSLGSNGYSKTVYQQRKVFKSQDAKDLIIGLCGSFNFQALEYENLFNELELLKGGIDRKYLITQFMPKLKEIVNKYNSNKNSNGLNIMSGELLFGYKDKLFRIQNDYSLLESSDPYQCVGSGEDFASGALYALEDNSDLSPAERIHKSLQAASKFSAGVAPPFYIINTKDDEVIELRE